MCRRFRILCGQSKSGDPDILFYSVPKLERKSYIEDATSVALINEILKTKFCLNEGNIDVIRILNRRITDLHYFGQLNTCVKSNSDQKFNIEFVSVVEKYEELYNYELEKYPNRQSQEKAWQNIPDQIERSAEH